VSVKIRDSNKPQAGGLYSGTWYRGRYQAVGAHRPEWRQQAAGMYTGWLDPQTDPGYLEPPRTGRP
jgi:hypothetical protein